MLDLPGMRSLPPTPDDDGRWSTPRAGRPTRPSNRRVLPPRGSDAVQQPEAAAAQPAGANACATPVQAPVHEPARPAGPASGAGRQGLVRTRNPVFRPTGGLCSYPAALSLGRPKAGDGVIKLDDTWAALPSAQAAQRTGARGTIVHGILLKPTPKHIDVRPSTSSAAERPTRAVAASAQPAAPTTGDKTANAKAARPQTAISHPGDAFDANNIGTQTDSPARFLAGRGATFALSPVAAATYQGGVHVNDTQPQGPFVHGEDLRYIGPKKRGGMTKSLGVKALVPSGKLMGSEVRAWWPDEAPADDGYIAGPGETSLWHSSPFALGREMDRYDRRTFGPNLSHKEWIATCKELKDASTKLSEMERSLRNGMMLQARALSKQASLVDHKLYASAAGSDVLSQMSTSTSWAEHGLAASTHPVQSVVSAGSHLQGYAMQGSLKVRDWLSPRESTSEASVVHGREQAKSKSIPDYEKLEKGARFGDSVLKTMRGQEALEEVQRVRENPPKFDHTNQRTERPHAVRTFRYYDGQGKESLTRKRIAIPEDEKKFLSGSQTDRPKSAAVQTHQGLGTYQRSACRDLVADAVNQINNDRNKNVTPRRRDAVFVDKLWNRFKGSMDKPYMFQPRAKRGIEEKILARVVADQIQPEVWITSKLGERHPDFLGRPTDGVARPGENLATPDLERKIGESLFPKNVSAGYAPARSEVSVVRRALEAGAGISTGNPLLQDERVKIKYA